MKKEKHEIEPELEEAKKLLDYIFSPYCLSRSNFTPRQMEVLKMKKTYGLNNKQTAEKLGLKEERVKQIYHSITIRIFHSVYKTYLEGTDAESLRKEVNRLKKENENYRKKFEALNRDDKEKFEELDVVMKKIEETELSKRIKNALYFSKIKTVGDLLQYRMSSLLLMRDFSIRMVEEVEGFANEHKLKIKR